MTRFDDVMHVLETPESFSSRARFTMVMGIPGRIPDLVEEGLRYDSPVQRAA